MNRKKLVTIIGVLLLLSSLLVVFSHNALADAGVFTLLDEQDDGGNYYGVWTDGTYVYTACDTAGVCAYSFDGDEYTLLDTDSAFPVSFRDVHGDGTYVYTACLGDGIRAYSFDGSDFTLLDTQDDGGSYIAIWCDETYIYVAGGSAGIRAYSFDGSDFTLLDTQDDGLDDYWDVWGDGTYIYTACLDDGIRAYSFDGSDFTLLDSYDWGEGNDLHGVWGDGTYIYTTWAHSGIRAYSFDGSDFAIVGNSRDDGSVYWDVWGDGIYLYVTNSNGGFRAYSFDGSDFSLLDTHTTGGGVVYRRVWGSSYLHVTNGDGLLAYSFVGFGEEDIVYVSDSQPPGWYDANHVMTFKEGVNNVTEGGLIRVWDGTYLGGNGNGEITKACTIVGNGTDSTFITRNGWAWTLYCQTPHINISHLHCDRDIHAHNYCTFDNIEVDGNNGTASDGIRHASNHHTTISNCYLHDNLFSGIFTQDNCHHITIENTRIHHCKVGMNFYDGPHNITIRNCTITDAYGSGLTQYGTGIYSNEGVTDWVVTDTTITGCSRRGVFINGDVEENPEVETLTFNCDEGEPADLHDFYEDCDGSPTNCMIFGLDDVYDIYEVEITSLHGYPYADRPMMQVQFQTGSWNTYASYEVDVSPYVPVPYTKHIVFDPPLTSGYVAMNLYAVGFWGENFPWRDCYGWIKVREHIDPMILGSGLNITDCYFDNDGGAYNIYTVGAQKNMLVDNCDFLGGWYGIIISQGGEGSLIRDNYFDLDGSSGAAILYTDADDGIVSTSNIITDVDAGIQSYNGMMYIPLYNNTITNCEIGMDIDEAEVIIMNNNITNCETGLWIEDSRGTVYNNIFNNIFNVYEDPGEEEPICWNVSKQFGLNIVNGWYMGGNYWSDYRGEDLDGDYLGDTFLPHQDGGIYTEWSPNGTYMYLRPIDDFFITMSSNHPLEFNYEQVDDVISDGDTSYVHTEGEGEFGAVDIYNMTNVSEVMGDNWAIYSIWLNATARQTEDEILAMGFLYDPFGEFPDEEGDWDISFDLYDPPGGEIYGVVGEEWGCPWHLRDIWTPEILEHTSFFMGCMDWGPECFLAGTQIIMSDGTTKPIEDIRIGDMVKGQKGDNIVYDLYHYILGDNLVYSINNGKYFVTALHPFMTIDGWKAFDPVRAKEFNPQLEIGQLELGDILITIDGNIELETISTTTFPFDTEIYNFAVTGDGTYYGDGYLVHNKCPRVFSKSDDGYVFDGLINVEYVGIENDKLYRYPLQYLTEPEIKIVYDPQEYNYIDFIKLIVTDTSDINIIETILDPVEVSCNNCTETSCNLSLLLHRDGRYMENDKKINSEIFITFEELPEIEPGYTREIEIYSSGYQDVYEPPVPECPYIKEFLIDYWLHSVCTDEICYYVENQDKSYYLDMLKQFKESNTLYVTQLYGYAEFAEWEEENGDFHPLIINETIMEETVVADFTYSPNDPLVGDTITFTDSSIGDIVEWYWTFGDGTSGYGKNKNHEYDEAGRYKVTLRVTGRLGGTNSTFKYVTVTQREFGIIEPFPGLKGPYTVPQMYQLLTVDKIPKSDAKLTIMYIDTGYTPRTYNNTDLSTIIATGDPSYTSYIDGNGHGTWISYALQYIIEEKLPNSRLISYKVFDNRGYCSLQMVKDAFDYAKTLDVDVVCFSGGGLGSPEDQLSKKVEELEKQGIFVCVAAGNMGPTPSSILSPSCSRGAFSVGAVDPMDTIRDVSNDIVCDWSSRGPVANVFPKPDYTAPGESIKGPWMNTERIVSGTSMAAPLFAGGTAVVYGSNELWLSIVDILYFWDSSIKQDIVNDCIKDTVREKGDINSYGYGIPDFNEANSAVFWACILRIILMIIIIAVVVILILYIYKKVFKK